MGSICPCFGQKPEYTYSPIPSSNSERTPLLSSGAYGATKETKKETVNSARLHTSSDPPDKVYSDKDLRSISVEDVEVTELDKQFRDHATLFNEYYEKYKLLKETLSNMLSVYDGTGVTPSNSSEVFKIVRKELTEEDFTNLKVVRKFKHCMELKFEPKFMSSNAVAVLDYFNKGNRLIKDLEDKGPMLIQTVTMVVESEEQAKRNVTVHYSDAERKDQGPEKLKICLNNMAEMKRVKPAVTYMRKESSKIFDELKDGATALFRDPEV